MDLMERAGTLKEQLVDFALSARFRRRLETVLDQTFPDGLVDDEAGASLVIDHFILQHRLQDGGTVVDRFVLAHPELSAEERDMLLGWKDVVEGIFEVRAKDGDAISLFNLVDELTYRTRSNMGKAAFRPLKKGMFLIGRVVPLGDDWLVSGNLAAFPASERATLLTQAAELSLRSPELVFRNPEKLATARRILADQRELFIELYGDELIVVSCDVLTERVNAFWNAVAEKAAVTEKARADFDFAEEMAFAETVAIHFDPDTGLSFYFDFGLLQALFDNPALIARRRYRETMTSYLRDDSVSPAAIRILAERDPEKAGVVFQKLLKKRGFSWAEHGEALLRKHKARYFEAPQLPTNIPVSETMAEHLRNARHS
ncbi:hypothetical protein ACQP2T_05640 [Nonomuraea sp. CA-143628]|uniref:hypothetical protein n=1 Tax=Nonomuraea sp. CA-143628 TaxID=3239997 RepID=UPI003D8C60EB